MPEIPSSPDKQQITSSLTTTDGPTTDEVDITTISSNDSSDCIILEGFEEGNGPDEEPKMNTPDEQPKVKRVRFATPPASPASAPTPHHLHHQLLLLQPVQMMEAISSHKGKMKFPY